MAPRLLTSWSDAVLSRALACSAYQRGGRKCTAETFGKQDCQAVQERTTATARHKSRAALLRTTVWGRAQPYRLHAVSGSFPVPLAPEMAFRCRPGSERDPVRRRGRCRMRSPALLAPDRNRATYTGPCSWRDPLHRLAASRRSVSGSRRRRLCSSDIAPSRRCNRSGLWGGRASPGHTPRSGRPSTVLAGPRGTRPSGGCADHGRGQEA
jgi:hypothetical protein